MISFLNFILKLIGAGWRIGRSNSEQRKINELEAENKEMKIQKKIEENKEKRREEIAKTVKDAKNKAGDYLKIFLIMFATASITACAGTAARNCTSDVQTIKCVIPDIEPLAVCDSYKDFPDKTCIVNCEYTDEFYELSQGTKIEIIEACNFLKEQGYKEYIRYLLDIIAEAKQP